MNTTSLNVFAVLLLAYICTSQSATADDILVDDARSSLIHDVRLPAREAGVLEELTVREGSRIKKGDVLGFIDKSLLTLQGDAAKLQSEIAKIEADNDVDLRFAKKSCQVSYAELQRFEDAVKAYPKAISESELDTARFTAERAEMSVEQAEKDVRVAGLTRDLRDREGDIAKTRITHAKLISPVNGMVVEVLQQPGEWAQIGQPIVRVIGLDKLRIEAFVNAEDCDAGFVGRPAEFTTRIPSKGEQSFPGKVVFVSPEVGITGQVRVWAEVENATLTLRSGAKGRLTIRDSSNKGDFPSPESTTPDSQGPKSPSDLLDGPEV